MQRKEADRILHSLFFSAAMNQRYHQALAWWWDFADRVVRIAVSVVATFGLLFAALGGRWTGAGLCIATIALILAILLNIVPFADTRHFYADLYRRWSDLRVQIDSLGIKITRCSEAEIPEPLLDRIEDVQRQKALILGSETAAWQGLLERCHGDQTEALWGKDIRTAEHVQEELSKRRTDSA